MNMKTIITSPTRCFYDVSFPFARSRQVSLNPMKIHIEGNLQHSRHTIRNGDFGQSFAGIERITSDRCHTISLAVIGNCFWNNYISAVLVIIARRR